MRHRQIDRPARGVRTRRAFRAADRRVVRWRPIAARNAQRLTIFSSEGLKSIHKPWLHLAQAGALARELAFRKVRPASPVQSRRHDHHPFSEWASTYTLRPSEELNVARGRGRVTRLLQPSK